MRIPPLGLPGGKGLVGVSFRDGYFLKSDSFADAAEHVRLITRVAQWRLLGDRAYFFACSLEHATRAPNENRLELQAADLARRAETGGAPFDALSAIHQGLRTIWP